MKKIAQAIEAYQAYRKTTDKEAILRGNLALIESYLSVEKHRGSLIMAYEKERQQLLSSLKLNKTCFETTQEGIEKEMHEILSPIQYLEFKSIFEQVHLGKRIRSQLFSSLLASFNHQTNYHLAALIELWHFTSLVYDDILDEASLRRNHPTLFQLYGPKKALILADCLLLTVLIEFAKYTLPIHQNVYDTFVKMNYTELLQLKNVRRVVPQYQIFDEYVKGKTSSLLELSLILALIDAKQTSYIKNAQEIAQLLGSAFQYRDDILDIEGTSDKDANQDIKNGILNYPYMCLIKEQPELMLMSFDVIEQTTISQVLLASCKKSVNERLERVRQKTQMDFAKQVGFQLQIIKMVDQLIME